MLHAKITGLMVPEKNIFKGFYHIWVWQPSWSCDLDHLYKFSFPLLKEAPHKIWLTRTRQDNIYFESARHITINISSRALLNR